MHIFTVCAQLLSPVQLFATSWTTTHQAQTLSMGFPRQEYWSELPFLHIYSMSIYQTYEKESILLVRGL